MRPPFLYGPSCQYQYRLSQQGPAGVLAVVAQSCPGPGPRTTKRGAGGRKGKTQREKIKMFRGSNVNRSKRIAKLNCTSMYVVYTIG